MILSQKTVTFLKVFSSINQGILINPGNVLKTLSVSKNIFSKVIVDQEFPKQFAVYDLSKFVSVVTMMDNPDIDFQEDRMLIRSGKQVISYTYCDPKNLVVPSDAYDGASSLKTRDVEFKLSREDFNTALKTASILSSKHLAFSGKEGKIFLECLDAGNETCDKNSQEICETDKNFLMVFNMENMRLIPRDYDVIFSSKGFAAFVAADIEYLVAAEAKVSHFGG